MTAPALKPQAEAAPQSGARLLVSTLERLGVELAAPEPFLIVISYNPGYQSVTRELKESRKSVV